MDNNKDLNAEQVRTAEENSLNLRDIWNMIWDNKWWYVVSVSVCLFVAMIYIYVTPKTYVRTAKVIINEETGETSMPNVFAGGDIVTGAATVILAMGAGRRAGQEIVRRLVPDGHK